MTRVEASGLVAVKWDNDNFGFYRFPLFIFYMFSLFISLDIIRKIYPL